MASSQRDRPWVIRTYSGHSSARKSNELYRKNLAKGQTGLSVAFDLPTQTGYDSDHPLARGEVGKVGVPIGHIEDMCLLFQDIPLDRMNTSMTINATAAWLLALYIAAAERQGVDATKLQGTTQNDIIKEYLSRGTYVFPPEASMRLISDMVAYSVDAIPRWNPINVCSYHLQEAGATPVQEIAYAMANAIAVLDAVRARDDVPEEALPRVFGRISFFLNSGIRFIDEVCKCRAMTQIWEELGRTRYGIEDEKQLRFRYGVQVNSLGLTEAQPENNVIRIVLEALGVTLSKRARARALQLPAWNEALGLPRPWDQQWSLRIQQILANETDLLEHGDIFDGSDRGALPETGPGSRGRTREGARHGGRGGGGRQRVHEAATRGVQYGAGARHRVRGPGRGRRERLHRDRGLPPHRGGFGGIHSGGGRRRGTRADRKPRGLPADAQQRRGRCGPGGAARCAQQR